MNVVWFKRDLRVADHAPLSLAAARGPLLCLYVIEPSVLRGNDFAGRHYRWIRSSLLELRESLQRLGGTLVVRVGEVVEVLEWLHGLRPIAHLWSHQETGNAITFARDRAVARWCRERRVEWTELPQFGVVRGLKSRDGWARRWERLMSSDIVASPTRIEDARLVEPGPIHDPGELPLSPDECEFEQRPGEQPAILTLESFLSQRGMNYASEISSPLTAATAGSRLSAYLAWGNISLRTVVQRTRRRLASPGRDPHGRNWRRSLRMFEARLHWHCHFIQKLETEPRIEHENFVRGFDGARPNLPDERVFDAWRTGRTGYPMVDAVMRCLLSTGWTNFRMRAMLMSFSSYHLWQHWREPALHLARCFIDYEPGIHFSQAQMQSGTTGINTLRIYSPTKQAIDHDPEGAFIRRWVPELRRVRTAFIHEPWKMSAGEQREVGCRIGTDYPPPLVDHALAVQQARRRMAEYRRLAETRLQSAEVMEKHGSRRSGLARASGKRRSAGGSPQPGLFA